MAWANVFYRKTDKTRSRWSHNFELTKEHGSPEDHDHLRYTYDILAEKVLLRLNEISPPATKALPRGNSQFSTNPNKGHPKLEEPSDDPGKPETKKPSVRDLYAILIEHKDGDPLLQEFWTEVTTVPDWVDWDQVQRGQDVFYRYGGAVLTGLTYMSLLGGFGAAKIVETLSRTGGFSTKVARNRLLETTQFLLQCTQSLEMLRPGGEGFKSAIRVRLLHASVRQRILKMAETRPEYFDSKENGIPINHLDSIGTIASFSSNLIWLALPRQGIFMRKQEIEDYVALWRYISYLLGSPTKGYFDTVDNARRIQDLIMLYEINPSPTSKILASNMIKALANQPPGYASADFLIASARWMNGNDLIDALGLPRPSVYYWALMAGQCLFFCILSYTYRSVPSWDRAQIRTLKRIFYKVVVHNKDGLNGEESLYAFRFIPQYSTLTELADSHEERRKGEYNDEARSLKTLLVVGASLGVLICLLGYMFTSAIRALIVA